MPQRVPDRVVFLGNPRVAAQSLQILLDAGVTVGLVVTGVPKRRGRGAGESVTPVHQVAVMSSIPVVHDLIEMTAFLDAHPGVWLGVVVAFGSLIPTDVLRKLPMVNIHFSLLPRWRGAAPVERAILAGDQEVGVCVMRVVERLDEGPIFSRASLPLRDSVTAEELRDELCFIGTTLLIDEINAATWVSEPQRGEESYARKIGRDEHRIDWSLPNDQVLRVVRIGSAFTHFSGRRLKVKAAVLGTERGEPGRVFLTGRAVVVCCGDGSLHLRRVQPEGKSEMEGLDWWNGTGSIVDGPRFD